MTERQTPATSGTTSIYLSVFQAAQVLGYSPRTLDDWRFRGGGPRYLKIGRSIRYRTEDLIDWAESHGQRNTGENTRAA